MGVTYLVLESLLVLSLVIYFEALLGGAKEAYHRKGNPRKDGGCRGDPAPFAPTAAMWVSFSIIYFHPAKKKDKGYSKRGVL